MTTTDDPFKPLRTVRTNVRSVDPALAMSPREIAAYQTSREWTALKFKDNAKPAVFVIEHPPAMFGPKCLDFWHVESRRQIVAFCYACKVIEMPDGSTWAADPKTFDQGPDGLTRAPESWSEDVAKKFGIRTVREMGALAIDLSELAEGETGPFGPPPG